MIYRYANIHIREFVEYHLLEDTDTFALWAFGPGFENIPPNNLYLRWNELHGNHFTVKGSDNAYETILDMIDIWKTIQGFRSENPESIEPNQCDTDVDVS